MRNRRKNKYMLLLILLLGISLGYALISTTLKINGSATVKKHTWDVYWGVPTVTTGSVTTTAPTRTQETGDPANTKLIWSTTLALPGDFYEFTVDAVNNGDVDAMITGIEPTVTPALPTNPDYIKYTVTYADGVTPAVNHLLAKNTTEKYKVRVYYDDAAATRDTINNMTSDTTYTFTLDITYGQATDEAYQRASTFQNDSWDVIATNVKKDKSVYPVGSTKTIEMDMDGDNIKETYTLRVANNTTPVECSQESFSQTACGFVVEFADVITKYRMNKRDSSGGNGYENHGGWEYSDMRAYLNNGIYLESTADEIDYTNSGFLNKLPSSLRSKIINTKVISGRGSYDINRDNFDTVDLIYLLATHEVWEDTNTAAHDGIHYYDTGYNNTRQLDYYKEQNVTISNYAGAIKNYKDTPTDWWLRSTGTDSPYGYFIVMPQGNIFYYGYCPSAEGVSPAFRLAE